MYWSMLYVTNQRQQTCLGRYVRDEKHYKLKKKNSALSRNTFCNWSEIKGRTVGNEQVGHGFETPDQLTNFTENIPFVFLNLKDKSLEFRHTKLRHFIQKKLFF